MDPRVRRSHGYAPDFIVGQLLYCFCSGGASLADAEVLGTLAPARLTVATLDPARQFMLDLGVRARLCPAQNGQVSGSLRLPTEALIRLVTGRLDPAHTPAGTVTEGRPTLDELRRLYPGA